MCFIEKMNCTKIRKSEDLVLDPVHTSGRVRYRDASTSQYIFQLSCQSELVVLVSIILEAE